MKLFIGNSVVYQEIHKDNGLAIWLGDDGFERVWLYVEQGDTTVYMNSLHIVFYSNSSGVGYFDNGTIIVSSDITPAIDCLLLEDGDYYLLEDGGRILLE